MQVVKERKYHRIMLQKCMHVETPRLAGTTIILFEHEVLEVVVMVTL